MNAKEYPLLMKPDMIRAYQAGRKTQMRRLVKPKWRRDEREGQPCWKTPWATVWDNGVWHTWDECGVGGENSRVDSAEKAKDVAMLSAIAQGFFRCPYGQPGDRLWFRETWVEHVVVWSGDGACPLLYRANDEHLLPAGQKWTPSIHMPRWAARYNPLITGVRVERLQSITEADAIAEGAHWMDCGKDKWGNQRNGWSMLTPHPGDPDRCLGSARYAFAAYINACSGGPNWNLKPSNIWDENQWVWVISFEPLGVKP